MVAAKVWNGTSWEFLGSGPVAQVQSTAPSGPAVGQFWLDTTTLAGGAGNGPYVCTSTTRPAHQVGLTIYESDTKLTLQSDGTSWYVVNAFGTPPEVDLAETGALAIGSGTGWQNINASAISVLALGSAYWRVEFGISYEWYAAANAACYIKVTLGASTTTTRIHNENTGLSMYKTAFISGISQVPLTGNVQPFIQCNIDSAGAGMTFAHVSGHWMAVPC